MIIVSIGLSGTVTEIYTCNIFVTMVTYLKYVFRKYFSGSIIFMTWIIRDYLKDHFSFYLTFLA